MPSVLHGQSWTLEAGSTNILLETGLAINNINGIELFFDEFDCQGGSPCGFAMVLTPQSVDSLEALGVSSLLTLLPSRSSALQTQGVAWFFHTDAGQSLYEVGQSSISVAYQTASSVTVDLQFSLSRFSLDLQSQQAFMSGTGLLGESVNIGILDALAYDFVNVWLVSEIPSESVSGSHNVLFNSGFVPGGKGGNGLGAAIVVIVLVLAGAGGFGGCVWHRRRGRANEGAADAYNKNVGNESVGSAGIIGGTMEGAFTRKGKAQTKLISVAAGSEAPIMAQPDFTVENAIDKLVDDGELEELCTYAEVLNNYGQPDAALALALKIEGQARDGDRELYLRVVNLLTTIILNLKQTKIEKGQTDTQAGLAEGIVDALAVEADDIKRQTAAGVKNTPKLSTEIVGKARTSVISLYSVQFEDEMGAFMPPPTRERKTSRGSRGSRGRKKSGSGHRRKNSGGLEGGRKNSGGLEGGRGRKGSGDRRKNSGEGRRKNSGEMNRKTSGEMTRKASAANKGKKVSNSGRVEEKDQVTVPVGGKKKGSGRGRSGSGGAGKKRKESSGSAGAGTSGRKEKKDRNPSPPKAAPGGASGSPTRKGSPRRGGGPTKKGRSPKRHQHGRVDFNLVKLPELWEMRTVKSVVVEGKPLKTVLRPYSEAITEADAGGRF